MFGYNHPLSKKTNSGKIIAGLNLVQLAVVLLGAKLSYEFSKIVPALPLKNFMVAHIHHFMPFVLSFLAVITKESRTGMPIAAYFYSWIMYKIRPKEYVWRRT